MKIIQTLFIFFLFSFSFFSQQKEIKQVDQKKHALNIELLGRTFFFGSFNYEYLITPNFSLGAGLGVLQLQQGNITRSNQSLLEQGRYFDAVTTQMIYVNYFLGKNRHKGVVSVGATNLLTFGRNKYPSETEVYSSSILSLNLGLGYQFSSKKMYYRLMAYCLSIPQPNPWFPSVIPWAGLSVGYRL